MPRKKRAFTIVELMVAVTIIIVLITILLPSLEKAKVAAAAVRCGSNLHAAGLAESLYLMDSKGRFPTMITWNMLFGNKGDNTYGEQGYNTAKDWPLNPYLGVTSNNAIVKVAECPADAGDVLNNKPNSYLAHGTSYLMPFAGDYFRVKHVYGQTGTANYSMKSSQIERTNNKVLAADWIWHANRALNDTFDRTHWHSNTKRLLSTLFADFHVVLLDWDNDRLEFPPYRDLPPDMNYLFW